MAKPLLQLFSQRLAPGGLGFSLLGAQALPGISLSLHQTEGRAKVQVVDVEHSPQAKRFIEMMDPEFFDNEEMLDSAVPQPTGASTRDELDAEEP